MSNNPIDRRTALYGAAVAAAGVTLAACSSASTPADAPASSVAPIPTGEANAIGDVAPAPTSTAAVSGAAVAVDGLGSAAAVKVGSGVIFEAAKVVVTQPTAGNYKAFSAVCTHQGCLVASVANGAISCPCHGSTFSIKDGSVITGPASTPLAQKKVTVSGGIIKLG